MLRRAVPSAMLALVALLLLAWAFPHSPPAYSTEPDTMDVERIVSYILDDPEVSAQSFYYDAGFKAIGSFAVHDHFAKRSCIGYLVTDGEHLAYRFIRSLPGLGSSNDAFETELGKVARVEYKFYRASKGVLDFYPERLSVKFIFEPPIVGLASNWRKDSMKFDIWNVQFARRLMGFLEQAGVKAVDLDRK